MEEVKEKAIVPSLAVGAMSDDVERVRCGVKPQAMGQVLDCVGHHRLERFGRSDVEYPSTDRAEEMVMMFGQFLRELESGEIVTGGDSSDDPGALEVSEMSIGGAPRHTREALADIGDIHRVP
jgi:hypothetical protein